MYRLFMYPGLHVVVDGSYTNKKMLRNLPENTTLIGRIRKDAKPGEQSPKGRKKFYGEDLPSPEQIRQDPDIPWVKVCARAGGRIREFEVKPSLRFAGGQQERWICDWSSSVRSATACAKERADYTPGPPI